METAATVPSTPAATATSNGNPAKVTGTKRCAQMFVSKIINCRHYFAFHYFEI